MHGSKYTDNAQGQVIVMKAVIPCGKLGRVRSKTKLTYQQLL